METAWSESIVIRHGDKVRLLDMSERAMAVGLCFVYGVTEPVLYLGAGRASCCGVEVSVLSWCLRDRLTLAPLEQPRASCVDKNLVPERWVPAVDVPGCRKRARLSRGVLQTDRTWMRCITWRDGKFPSGTVVRVQGTSIVGKVLKRLNGLYQIAVNGRVLTVSSTVLRTDKWV